MFVTSSLDFRGRESLVRGILAREGGDRLGVMIRQRRGGKSGSLTGNSARRVVGSRVERYSIVVFFTKG